MELILSFIVCAIILGAWAFIAHAVWKQQEIDREHLIEDVHWEPRAEPQGRR